MHLRALKARPSVRCSVAQQPTNGACHDEQNVWGAGRVSQRGCAYACRERHIRPDRRRVSRRVCLDAFPAVGGPIAASPIAASPEKRCRDLLADGRGLLRRAVECRTHGGCHATHARRYPIHQHIWRPLGLGTSISAGCRAFRATLCVELHHAGRDGCRARRQRANRQCHAVLLIAAAETRPDQTPERYFSDGLRP